MAVKRIFLQPVDMVLNAIHDLAELQKGRKAVCDSAQGLVSFHIVMYGVEREYRFCVLDIGKNRCGVFLDVTGDAVEKERLIDTEFALLEYVLKDIARFELAEIEREDNCIQTLGNIGWPY